MPMIMVSSPFWHLPLFLCFFFRPRPILSGPTYAGGLGFPAVLRVPKPNRFQHVGRIRRAEQIIRRRTAIRVPPVPEVERQAGQATAAAGLPAFVQALRPDGILPEVEDVLNVLPGLAADAHGVKECLVVGIKAANPSEALFIEFLVFSVFEFDRHFVPPFGSVVQGNHRLGKTMTSISALIVALLGAGRVHSISIDIFFPAGKCYLGGECERGGSSPLFREQVKDALPPGCDEEFLPICDAVFG